MDFDLMKIFVTVKPNSKEERVLRVDNVHYMVAVKVPPTDGKANQAVERVLAKHFSVAKSMVHIIKGYTAKRKIAEVILST